MVDRCICYAVPFVEIARRAKLGKSFEVISADTGCCRGCGMCEPYVKVVVATGRTSLPVLTRAQSEAIVAQAAAWKAGRRGGAGC